MKLYPYQQQYLDFLLSDYKFKAVVWSRQMGRSYVNKMYEEYLKILRKNKNYESNI